MTRSVKAEDSKVDLDAYDGAVAANVTARSQAGVYNMSTAPAAAPPPGATSQMMGGYVAGGVQGAGVAGRASAAARYNKAAKTRQDVALLTDGLSSTVVGKGMESQVRRRAMAAAPASQPEGLAYARDVKDLSRERLGRASKLDAAASGDKTVVLYDDAKSLAGGAVGPAKQDSKPGQQQSKSGDGQLFGVNPGNGQKQQAAEGQNQAAQKPGAGATPGQTFALGLQPGQPARSEGKLAESASERVSGRVRSSPRSAGNSPRRLRRIFPNLRASPSVNWVWKSSRRPRPRPHRPRPCPRSRRWPPTTNRPRPSPQAVRGLITTPTTRSSPSLRSRSRRSRSTWTPPATPTSVGSSTRTSSRRSTPFGSRNCSTTSRTTTRRRRASDPFAVHVEVAGCPWNADHRLVADRAEGQADRRSERPPQQPVFLIDVSGSMNEPNKLPLVKSLAAACWSSNSARTTGWRSSSTPGLGPGARPRRRACGRRRSSRRSTSFSAGGSTNGGAGIQLAYDLAVQNFIKGGTNRVILATDGDFNVGITDRGDLVRLIEAKRRAGSSSACSASAWATSRTASSKSSPTRGTATTPTSTRSHEAEKVLVEEMGGDAGHHRQGREAPDRVQPRARSAPTG